MRGKHREDGLLPVKGRGMVSDSKRGGKERGREGDRETGRETEGRPHLCL